MGIESNKRLSSRRDLRKPVTIRAIHGCVGRSYRTKRSSRRAPERNILKKHRIVDKTRLTLLENKEEKRKDYGATAINNRYHISILYHAKKGRKSEGGKRENAGKTFSGYHIAICRIYESLLLYRMTIEWNETRRAARKHALSPL